MTIMCRHIHLLSLSLLFFLAGCLSPLEPPDLEENSSISIDSYSLNLQKLLHTSNSNNNRHGEVECKKVYANYTGDVLLGSLFPIRKLVMNNHMAHEERDIRGFCGSINVQDGLQVVEALMFALDKINEMPNFLRVKLGVIGVDTCQDTKHALHQSMDLIKILMARMVSLDQLSCSNGETPEQDESLKNLKKIVGVLGADESDISITIANFLQLFEIPQVSYFSTTTELTNLEKFPYFLRTVPNDLFAIRAIVELLKTFSWSYVNVIYDDSNYGANSFAVFEEAIRHQQTPMWHPSYGDDSFSSFFIPNEDFSEVKISVRHNVSICIANKIKLEARDPKWQNPDFQLAVIDLFMRGPAKVILLFLSQPTVVKLFQTIRNHRSQDITDQFLWIGTDSWGGRDLSEDAVNYDILSRSITVMPRASIIPGFKSYFKSLRPSKYRRNPWLEEYFEEKCNCTYQFGFYEQNGCRYEGYAKTSPPPKTWCEKIEEKCAKIVFKDYRQLMYLHFVMDGVFSFAHAMKDIQDKNCEEKNKCVPTVDDFNGDLLLETLRMVNFTDSCNKEFRFWNGIDGPPRYSLLTYDVGNRDWEVAGSYEVADMAMDSQFQFTSKFLQFASSFPSSLCSKECQNHQAKRFTSNNPCCWVCINCTDFQFIRPVSQTYFRAPSAEFPSYSSTKNPMRRFPFDASKQEAPVFPLQTFSTECATCEPGSLPNINKTMCIQFEQEFMHFGTVSGSIVVLFSAFGLLLTCIVAISFYRFQNTPVVKATGRETSIVLMIGAAISYIMAIVLTSYPTIFVCLLSGIGPGLCGTICYSAILAKTNRVARIFHLQQAPSRRPPRFTSPLSQVYLMMALISAEIIILLIISFVNPPKIVEIQDYKRNWLLCHESILMTFISGLICPLLLVALSTFYAFRIRKTPDGFNETRSLLFINHANCLLYATSTTLAFVLSHTMYDTLPAACLLVISSYTNLLGLFLPKVYIVWRHPEKNTKQAIFTRSISMNPANCNGMHPGSPLEHSSESINSMDNNNPVVLDANQRSIYTQTEESSLFTRSHENSVAHRKVMFFSDTEHAIPVDFTASHDLQQEKTPQSATSSSVMIQAAEKQPHHFISDATPSHQSSNYTDTAPIWRGRQSSVSSASQRTHSSYVTSFYEEGEPIPIDYVKEKSVAV